MSGHPDLVIFDNDGVLVDSERAANAILADLLTSYGQPTTLDEAVATHLGTSLAQVRSAASAAGVTVPAGFEDDYHRRLFAAFDAGLRPVPGVVAVVEGLEVPSCVASSGGHERIRRALRSIGLLDHFEGRIFSAADVAQGKPAPDLFLHAAASMGARPSSCVVIEDSPAGVAAGVAAGMTVFGYAGLTPAERLREAHVVFTDMGSLPGLLAAALPL